MIIPGLMGKHIYIWSIQCQYLIWFLKEHSDSCLLAFWQVWDILSEIIQLLSFLPSFPPLPLFPVFLAKGWELFVVNSLIEDRELPQPTVVHPVALVSSLSRAHTLSLSSHAHAHMHTHIPAHTHTHFTASQNFHNALLLLVISFLCLLSYFPGIGLVVSFSVLLSSLTFAK